MSLYFCETYSTLPRPRGWSRLPARSALQGVSRLEVATGDPRPLARLTPLTPPAPKRGTPALRLSPFRGPYNRTPTP